MVTGKLFYNKAIQKYLEYYIYYPTPNIEISDQLRHFTYDYFSAGFLRFKFVVCKVPETIVILEVLPQVIFREFT